MRRSSPIFLPGYESYDGSSHRNDILEYNPETETWQDIDTMEETRSNHAVTIVSLEDYAAWCE